jgi:hypothetical protein
VADHEADKVHAEDRETRSRYGADHGYNNQNFATSIETGHLSNTMHQHGSWNLTSTANLDINADALFESPSSLGSVGDTGDFKMKTCLLTPREAILMRNFIENMALWVRLYVAYTEHYVLMFSRPMLQILRGILKLWFLVELLTIQFFAMLSSHSLLGMSVVSLTMKTLRLWNTTINVWGYSYRFFLAPRKA